MVTLNDQGSLPRAGMLLCVDSVSVYRYQANGVINKLSVTLESEFVALYQSLQYNNVTSSDKLNPEVYHHFIQLLGQDYTHHEKGFQGKEGIKVSSES